MIRSLLFAWSATVSILVADPALVVDVHDGDTITAKFDDGHTAHIRVAAIDAPELKQPGGIGARDQLRRWLAGQTIDVRSLGLDRYGRVTARLFDGRVDIAARAVTEGHAWVYRQYWGCLTTNEKADYARAEDTAKKFHRGLWSESTPTAPWIWRHSKH